MKLVLDALQDRAWWEDRGYALPEFDVRKAAEACRRAPGWVHFGAGNIYRAFIALLCQKLLNAGDYDRGMLAADTFDHDIIDKIYAPHDNLSIAVMMHPDASLDKIVVGSVGCARKVGQGLPLDDMTAAFSSPALQMASFTITEKGYALRALSGDYQSAAAADIAGGPANPRHVMGIVTRLLLDRFRAGAYPIAMVSMDNCSRNGEKLRGAVLEIAGAWRDGGFVPQAFFDYVSDETRVAFPWTMIDKITPRPDTFVQKTLEADGLDGIAPIVTDKKTFIAPFVNAEVPQYLVVEDNFPAGRPPLEKAGVLFADRATVNRVETMKVTTCLNPLHTALAVYGCLLGYTRISDEMKDAELSALVRKIGYDEGMPVVVDPGVINPRAFIDEVVNARFPNPFIPDTPQRIATDTSQKVGVRYGETIKSYAADASLDVKRLTFIPLAIAGWLRYLVGIGDDGQAFELSPDPMLPELKAALAGVRFGDEKSADGALVPILSNRTLFGSDLVELGLSDKIESMFRQMLAGPGAVRATLRAYLD